MKKTLAAAAAALLLAGGASAAMKSGLKVGEPVPAFQVVDVSGPNKGKQLCYRCSFGGNAVVAAFVRNGAKELGSLSSSIQKLTEQHPRLKSFVVVMGGPESKATIEKITREQRIKIPVTFLPEGPRASDIGQYQINPEASNTILLWTKGEVKANFVNVTEENWGQVARAAAEMVR